MAKQDQGKQLSPEKIAEIGALQELGAGGKRISKASNLSRSTVHKYQKLTPALRDQKKEGAIDRSWQIVELMDKKVLELADTVTAKEAAIIGKIQTDRLLDLTNPDRNSTQVLNANLSISDDQLKRLIEG